jgi:hypothetical protein
VKPEAEMVFIRLAPGAVIKGQKVKIIIQSRSEISNYSDSTGRVVVSKN